YVIEDLKRRIPSDYRKYSAEAKAWRINSRFYMADWLSGVKEWEGVEVEWETAGERRPYPAPPQTPRALPARDAALVTLHLLPSGPPELIRAAHKALAFIHHPDRGGDLERMKSINNAADILLKECSYGQNASH